MVKEIKQGNEARQKIADGMGKAADAVRATLGAVGMTALIEYPGLDPIECDDGVTILKNLEFSDAYENMGLQTLRKAALRTSVEGGDGTATTTVLTQALVAEALKEMGGDSSRIREIRERLDAGLVRAMVDLREQRHIVESSDVEKIARISSLDDEVSTLIAGIINEVGTSGVVTVERGAQLGYTSEVVKGARFDKGLISPFFINDHERHQTVLEDAYIILTDRKISTNEQIVPILQSIGTGKDILIIATDVESVALGTLAHNAVNKIADIACVRNPYAASPSRDFLFDIAALTGATVISEERGQMLDKADVTFCGRAEKVIVTRDTTTIIGGRSNESALQERIAMLQGEIGSTTSEYQKGLLEDRLAALTGGIGVIRVGAYTDTEFNAKKYKFENAVNATQAALQEGALPGGGIALLRASYAATEPIFARALPAPFLQMAKNAGVHPLVITDKLDTSITTQGYDFKNKKVVDMIDAGIIDPFKVTRLALESATAIAKAVIGMETAIVTIKTDEKDSK